ncbi:MAG: HAMP domain-containing histidine kinase [Flavobacteriales bacterium]|nr:HAMP domain-containing histidine kinase [Flavobacteriales bacterium]
MSADRSGPDKDLKVHSAQAERLHRFSHDLKNRLNGIGGSLRLLDELPAGAERDEVRAYAERSYYKALHDLENVLDDLGVERGPGTIRSAPVDLVPLVRRIIDELGHRIERKKVHLILESAPELIVQGDETLLHQVLSTLLSNAIKFSHPNGSVVIDGNMDGGHATLTVRDEGVGLSAEDLPQTFKAYAWLSSQSTQGEEQGRGSLARAMRAVLAHGGSLSVESDGPGKGCTFKLDLAKS